MSRVDIKEKSKKDIKGKIGLLFLCELIIYCLIVVCEISAILPIIGVVLTTIVGPIIQYGRVPIYLNVARGKKSEVKNIFDGFNNFGNVWCTSFLVGFFTILWTLLFIIPGIIKAYSYSMAFYIINDNPNMKAIDAIKKSEEMMNGHKMDLFILHLSFLGWMLLGLLTLGILYIWVIPYYYTAIANFYNSIKEKNA